jgi:hypothetical protein
MVQSSVLAPIRENSNNQNNLNRSTITKILGAVTNDNAFFFYEEIGKPTGALAKDLFDLCSQISSVTSKCLVFHMKRGDFENWIRDIIGDVELANRIEKLKNNEIAWKGETKFRNQLHTTVRNRLVELQNLLYDDLSRQRRAY